MSKALEETRHLMGALVRMKPKPHEEMKIGKSKTKTTKSQRSKSHTEKHNKIK